MKVKPRNIRGKWYIAVFTKELGETLLLEEGQLPIPISFGSEQEAIRHIEQMVAR